MPLNLTPDQLVKIAEAIGPAALSLVGLVIAGLLSLIGWGLRFMWKTYQRRSMVLAKSLNALTQAVDNDRKAHSDEIRVIREALQAVRTEVALSTRGVENATAKINELKGVVELQQRDLKENNEKLGKVDGKMEAIFKFIDAPKRATDT